MITRKTLAIALLAPFSLLTVYAISEVGYWGIIDYNRHSPAGWQVFTDLCICLGLIMLWMFKDAQKHGRNPWPWFLFTLIMGGIGPLLYLATEKNSQPIWEVA